MTMEEMFIELDKRDLRCTGIFRVKDTGAWKANIRHATGFYDYGFGDTPSAALKDGLARASGSLGPENRNPHGVHIAAEEPMDLGDLI